jgi:hypothetical protein
MGSIARLLIVVIVAASSVWGTCSETTKTDQMRELPRNVSILLERVSAERKALARDDIQTICVLVEEFARKFNYYPGAPGPANEIKRQLQGFVGESLLAQVPQLDPWGNAYLYWTNGKDYFVVTVGPDGKPGADYRALGQTVPFGVEAVCTSQEDIVLVDGQLCEGR